MKKAKVWSLLFLVTGLMAACVGAISAKSTSDKTPIVIRDVYRQVVLYTIYRGSYDKTGATIGKLFALAGSKKISPSGPISYVYLNNPGHVSKEHWLTEIRIPVGEDALRFAGTLGEMTDVKALPALELAVAVKPKGQADPRPIYDRLYAWIYKQGYVAAEDPMETFLTDEKGGDYAQMKTELMVPVKKLPKESKQKD
jgi:effector-binding domain-containing protein